MSKLVQLLTEALENDLVRVLEDIDYWHFFDKWEGDIFDVGGKHYMADAIAPRDGGCFTSVGDNGEYIIQKSDDDHWYRYDGDGNETMVDDLPIKGPIR